MAVAGIKSAFKLDDSGGTLRDLTQKIEGSVSFNQVNNLIGADTLGRTNTRFVTGLKDATFSFNVLWDTDLDLWIYGGTQPDSRSFEWFPEGTASGKIKYSGECVLRNTSMTAGVDTTVMTQLECQVTSEITRGTA